MTRPRQPTAMRLDQLFALGCQRHNFMLVLEPHQPRVRMTCTDCDAAAVYHGFSGEIRGGPKQTVDRCNIHGAELLEATRDQHRECPLLFSNFTGWPQFNATMMTGHLAWMQVPPHWNVVPLR
jgi:hypothetical protein